MPPAQLAPRPPQDSPEHPRFPDPREELFGLLDDIVERPLKWRWHRGKHSVEPGRGVVDRRCNS
jgi:hypothetical protein